MGARVIRRLTGGVLRLVVVVEIAWLLALDEGFRGISEDLDIIGGGIVFPVISKVFAGEEEGRSFGGRFRRSSMVHGCVILQWDRQ